MSSFGQAAASLLRKVEVQKSVSNNNDRSTVLAKLDESGFSIEEIFRDLRALYDTTEDEGLKRQIAADILRVRGLMNTENTKPAPPSIIIQVAGDNTKINAMLCPVEG